MMHKRLMFRRNFLISLIMAMFVFSFYSCLAKETVIPKETMKKIEKVVDQPSCFAGVDGMIRKSRKFRIKDMIKWYKVYGTVNGQYNEYGLDVKNFRNQDDFLNVKIRQKERFSIHHDNLDPLKYRHIYGNKFGFYKIMLNSKLANKTPKIYYIIEKGKVIFPKNELELSASEALKSLKNGKYICKPENSLCGHGVHLIEKNNEEISYYERDSSEIASDEFFKDIDDGPYLIQEYVYQHEKLNKLNKLSLNTVRIITTRYNDEPQILGSFLRMGVGKSIVDNVSAGGTCVGVNIDNGKLKKYGFYYSKFNKKVALQHPDSKIKYEGYQLPYWKEIIKLVKDAHKIFYGLSSIGWDVAITEKGPVIVELNAWYEFCGMQATNGGLKDKWHTLKKM